MEAGGPHNPEFTGTRAHSIYAARDACYHHDRALRVRLGARHRHGEQQAWGADRSRPPAGRSRGPCRTRMLYFAEERDPSQRELSAPRVLKVTGTSGAPRDKLERLAAQAGSVPGAMLGGTRVCFVGTDPMATASSQRPWDRPVQGNT